jgi:FtsH-binding integral membrane protein
MSQYPYRPEQPAWIDGRTTDATDRERAFFRSVYAWMFGGLGLTALASLLVASSPTMQRLVVFNPIVLIVLLLAELGIVIYASRKLETMSHGAAVACFIVYSLLTGLTISFVLFAYTRGTVVQAFGTAAGMFAAMSVYAQVTKRDLGSWGKFLYMGVIGILITMVINMFIGSHNLDMAISSIAVFVFAGLTAYKTQTLRQYAHAGNGRAETYAVYGALSLYITFINLFLHLLRLFGGSRR